jgi:hypothetical protein
MFEKLQVNGYDKENDVAIQLTTSNLEIALGQYDTVKKNCNSGTLVNADTGELYAHFSIDEDHCGITHTEWVNNDFIEAIEELTEYGCP